ncbi:MAG: hypothetical protein A2231_10550 [Candidatus Firestonebacteria bacterium RIFOXYA2_FULL_40_8]|nr:MAG: hypothetical protein A2231_10550 [Candidatus Firestonebacteria bacterium RIFOXYA2_FULL_40_8]
MEKIKVLVVEDDDLMLNMLLGKLQKAGFFVTAAGDGLEGLVKSKEDDFSLALIDLNLPKLDGVALLSKIKETLPDMVCIMMTGYGTVETAVSAMKLGAFDYVTKPFIFEELLRIMNNALELQSLKKENLLLKERLGERGKLNNIIGKSRGMQEVYRLIEAVAQGLTSVLILGESGTGKELVAEAIHNLSERKAGPLIKVNCSALTESLLESELFGHEKGSFTGADKRRIGRFEMADHGTIFLDDIDDMKPAVQVKLLRVLQEREFERVGGTETIKTDVRVITASKTDLKEKIADGTFREDLYYRLNVVQIPLPPLWDRISDLPLLAEHFLKQYNKKTGKNVSFAPKTLQVMMNYNWPGNIRELENLVERFVSLSESREILPGELPLYFKEKKKWKAVPLKKALKEAEKEHILKALEYTKGQKKKAAELLGITPKNLWEKMKEK